MGRPLGSKDKKPRSDETRQRMSIAKRGDRNGAWRGEAVGYRAAHSRLHRRLGKASEKLCKCGKRALDWANLTGNFSDLRDYEAMCRSCHRKYDKNRTIEV